MDLITTIYKHSTIKSSFRLPRFNNDDLLILFFPALFLVQRKEYVKYAKVFPLTTLFDIKIASKWYRRVVGSLEMISGLAMMVIPNRKQIITNYRRVTR